MIIKLSEKQRETLRILRKLWQNVFKRIHDRNFQYVLQRQAPGKICFGSGVERECLPFKGPAKTPLMRRLIPDSFSKASPGSYNIATSLIKKCPNKSGYAGLAYKTPRVTMSAASLNPPVGTYEISPDRKYDRAAKPFNVGDLFYRKERHITPAPGTYNFQKRKIIINTGFGKQRIHFPAVRVICAFYNAALCCICEEIPFGDYWRHDATQQDMCRPCMIRQRREANMMRSKCKKLKRLTELDKFIRVRYCGIYHDHGGTKAAINVLTNRHMKLKFRTENYLATFHY